MVPLKIKVGLVVKQDKQACKKADELEKRLESENICVMRKENSYSDKKVSGLRSTKAPNDLFCIFVLGGDGTFLSAVRWIDDQDIPILGVKFGQVGFLAAIYEHNLFSVTDSILKNRFKTEKRMRLEVSVLRNGKQRVKETVLNDMVINKGTLARLASIKTYIDDYYLTTYRADGLIVCSPTGSTAYSLAAGGPIVHPAVSGIMLTPICPFTLTIRPLITPDSVCIKLKLTEKSSDIMLTFDGQSGVEIDHQDEIIIKKSPHPIRMISMHGQDYFDVVKTKLRWSGGKV